MTTADGPSLKDETADRILIVDDEEPIRRMLARLLGGHGYTTHTAADVDEARSRLEEHEFSLVLADMSMPGGSGLDLLSHVKQNRPNTAIMMVTGMADTSLANTALEMGAYGYVIKPVDAQEMLIGVMNALRRRELELENTNYREKLEEMVRLRTTDLWEAISSLEQVGKELRLSQEETIHRLSIAAELRDRETAGHIERMSRYCHILARGSGEDAEHSERIRLASKMHDVGKIGIPDSILLKPGKFTHEERNVMQRHAEIGYEILQNSDSELLRIAATITLTHHERVDGKGYPNGLGSDEIPLEGRIAAIADVFDALTSERPYKKAFPLGQAVEIMTEERGRHFDPELLDLFLNSIEAVVEVMHQYPVVKRTFAGSSA